jgi:hypothetical protein
MTRAFVGPPNLVLLTYVRSGSPATPGGADDEVMGPRANGRQPGRECARGLPHPEQPVGAEATLQCI